MNSNEFCYWLKGFIDGKSELTDDCIKGINVELNNVIKEIENPKQIIRQSLPISVGQAQPEALFPPSILHGKESTSHNFTKTSDIVKGE